MSEKIRTKTFNHSDQEGSWPSMYGTRDTTPYYIDPVNGGLHKGYPVREVKEVNAPTIISDTLKQPHYHQGACKWTESRSELERLDRATGCFTTDKKQEAPTAPHRKRLRERYEDGHKALHKAVAQVDAGTAP